LQALDLQLELHLRRPRRLRRRPGQLPQPAVEPRVLRLQQQRHLPQPLEVRLGPQPHHRGASGITLLAYCQVAAAGGVHVRGRTTPGESAVRVSNVQPSRNRLSSLSVSVRPAVAVPAGTHSAANRPCSSRLWYTQSPVPSHSSTFARVRSRFTKRKQSPASGSWPSFVTSPPSPSKPFRRSAGAGYAHTRRLRVLPIIRAPGATRSRSRRRGPRRDSRPAIRRPGARRAPRRARSPP